MTIDILFLKEKGRSAIALPLSYDSHVYRYSAVNVRPPLDCVIKMIYNAYIINQNVKLSRLRFCLFSEYSLYLQVF